LDNDLLVSTTFGGITKALLKGFNKFGNRLFYQIDWEILDTLLDEWWIKAEKIKSLNNGIKELYDNEEYSDEI